MLMGIHERIIYGENFIPGAMHRVLVKDDIIYRYMKNGNFLKQH
jgi:hypothetical protein